MFRQALVVLGLSLGMSVSVSAKTETPDDAKQYGEVLQAALANINGPQNKEKLEEQMQELFKLSKGLNQRFSDRHAECKDYLGKALAQADKMPDMTLAQIEKDYHADGALPKASPLCYHVKDLLVHPATVLVVLKSKNGQVMPKALAELTELNSHLAVVQAKLK